MTLSWQTFIGVFIIRLAGGKDDRSAVLAFLFVRKAVSVGRVAMLSCSTPFSCSRASRFAFSSKERFNFCSGCLSFSSDVDDPTPCIRIHKHLQILHMFSWWPRRSSFRCCSTSSSSEPSRVSSTRPGGAHREPYLPPFQPPTSPLFRTASSTRRLCVESPCSVTVLPNCL